MAYNFTIELSWPIQKETIISLLVLIKQSIYTLFKYGGTLLSASVHG